MKKVVLIIVVMACMISQIDAQVRFGLKAGLNFDSPKVEKSISSVEKATGWQAGAMLQVMFPILGIGVQPELLYTSKKTDVGITTSGISYFELPINLRYEINLVLLRPYLTAGPYFGYVAGASGAFNKDHIEKTDWGIGVGGGLEIWKLHAGLRYSWGMNNIGKHEELYYLVGDELKNRTFTVSLGYLF